MDLGDVGGQSFSWDAATAVTVAIDVWEIAMTAGLYGRAGGISLTQTTDLGDAAHEIINFQWVYGNTTSGSGGSASPIQSPIGFGGDRTGVSAVECRNTTAASGGSPAGGIVHGWNVLQPLDLWYPNGLEPTLQAPETTAKNVVRLLAAPADSITMHSTVYIRNGVYA